MKFVYVGGLAILLAFSVQVAVAETTTTYDAAGNIIQTTVTGATTDSSSGGTTADTRTTDTKTTETTATGVVCTAEYAPVCGEVEVQCVTAPCNPIQETFSNSCHLKARGAKFLHEGECKTDSTGNSGSSTGSTGDSTSGSAGASAGSEDKAVSDSSRDEETKESGEKGGTEDINIGVGELQETSATGERTVQSEIISLSLSGDDGHKDWIIIESVSTGETTRVNKSDLLDSISSDPDNGLRAAFIKIGDIKGEAADNAAPEGDGTEAQTSKPKEIVVVGSKVRDEDIPFPIQWGGTGSENAAPDSFFDIWIDAGEDRNAAPDSFFDIFTDLGEDRSAPDSFFDIFVDVTGEDVALQAISVAQANENVEEVQVLENEVKVTYDEPMRLLGFIPLQGTRTVVVDTSDPSRDGRVKVQFPWWRFLATTQTDAESLSEAIETELDATIPVVPVDDRPTEEVAFYYNKIQAQTLQTISNIAK